MRLGGAVAKGQGTLKGNGKDLTGLVVGRLTVIKIDGKTSDGHLAWICACECGKTKIISSQSLTKRKPSTSCGCRNYDVAMGRKRPGGVWNERKSYAIVDGAHCYKSRAAWSKAAIREYGNSCQRCGWSEARCDVHHKIKKSDGGLNTILNAVVLCPNCHRLAHDGCNYQ